MVHAPAHRSAPAKEIKELRSRLQIAEETLRALSEGKVDVIVKSGLAGDEFFTRKSPDRPYRLMVEAMSEGAVTLGLDGAVLYCNQRFAELVKEKLERVIGAEIYRFIAPVDVRKFDELMRQAIIGPAREGIELICSDGTLLPAYAAVRAFKSLTGPNIVVVVTDLTELRQAEAIVHKAQDELELRIAERTNDLTQERDFSAALIDGLPGLFILFNEKGQIVRWNKNLSIVTGLSDQQLQGADAFSIVTENDRDMARRKLTEVFKSGLADVELALHAKGGEVREYHWSGRVLKHDGPPRTIGIGVDVTEVHAAEKKLRTSEERFRAVSETALDAIVIIDPNGKVIFWNPAAERIIGYSASEAVGRPLAELTFPARTREMAMAEMSKISTFDRGQDVRKLLELTAISKDGTEFPIELSISGMQVDTEWHIVAMLRDITQRKFAEAAMMRAARHDVLTGLANRAVFVEELERTFSLANRDGESFAVLYLDLDHFKDVNDTMGHPVGDLLLQAVAQRLKGAVREVDLVARFGGDEFAVLVAQVEKPADAAVLGDRVLKALSEPYPIQGNDIRSGVSIGIAVYGLDSPDVETLLSHADVALYRAKSEGRGTYRFFTVAMDKEVRTRVTLAAELRVAITAGQLFLVYQPQVNIDTGRIIGVEALVRWRHPTRGMISPGKFIPVAEESGLVVALGHWVLHEACRQMKVWLDAGIAPPLIGVNVSGQQFKRPFELENYIASTLAETGLSSAHLELELTETVFMETSREHNDVLLRLRKSGLRLAIDDFGSGYSSLEYLSRFPVNRVKIAQNFIIDLVSGSANATIVRAAISMAHDLGLDVIIEGVETAEQLELIRSFDGHKVQGFYFSKPVPSGEATAILRKGKISPARPVVAEASAK